jgi:hypothetical protein
MANLDVSLAHAVARLFVAAGTFKMLKLELLRQKALWVFLALSCLAAIEPSPYDLMFFAVLAVFWRGGLRFDKTMAPLIVSLLVYSAAELLALIPYVDEPDSVRFAGITTYISFTTFLFAAIVAASPASRMETIRSGYVFAALVASLLGILGYFDIAGLGPYFTLYDNTRAMGPFKDPNVFGPFLVPPIIWLCQDVLLRRGRLLAKALKLVVLLVAILLSFSRGAILDCIASAILLLGLTFVTSTSPKLRGRTVAVAVFGAILVAILLSIVLAIPEVRDLATSRASLVQDYDAGEQGRFGNQLRSIPLLLERPFGFGPYRFVQFFPQDPHEVFLSAFASGGWIGGLAFAAFIAVTLYLGCALALRRTALQREIIALWSALLPQILQGVQIDTSHWRHLFLMCGCLFGLAAAVRLEGGERAGAPRDLRSPSEPGATAATASPQSAPQTG